MNLTQFLFWFFSRIKRKNALIFSKIEYLFIFKNIFCKDESPPFVPKYKSQRENCENHISYEGCYCPCTQQKKKQ